MTYKRDFYAPIGDFLREKYLEWGFTKGTLPEVDFLIDLLQPTPGARVLDVGCGPGRHSLELARRGLRPLGVDISRGFIEVARRRAAEAGLTTADFSVGDATMLDLPAEFDFAICLCEGAFGLAGSEEGHRAVLSGIYRALKPGGRLVLTAINTLAAIRRITPASEFDPYTCTSVEHEVIMSPEGETREVTIYTTSFTYRELTLLLEQVGLVVEEGYGCVAGRFARKPLEIDDTEIMMIARKPLA